MCLHSLIPVGIFELPLFKNLNSLGVHLLLDLLQLSQSSIDRRHVVHIVVQRDLVVEGAAVVVLVDLRR